MIFLRAKAEVHRSWKTHPFLLHQLKLPSLFLPQTLDKDVDHGNLISQLLYPGVLSAGWVPPESLSHFMPTDLTLNIGVVLP